MISAEFFDNAEELLGRFYSEHLKYEL